MTFLSKLAALLTAASVSSALPASPWGSIIPVPLEGDFAANNKLGLCAADVNTSVAMGWYASWHEGYAPLAEVSWNKYTHMAFASVYVPFSFICFWINAGHSHLDIPAQRTPILLLRWRKPTRPSSKSSYLRLTIM